MNQNQKNEIRNIVIEQIELLGSMRKVGNKANVSEATISLIKNNKGDDFADKMWIKIGVALGWKNTGWNVVDTLNSKMIHQVFQSSKKKGMWMAISNYAGSGKTEACNMYENQKLKGVYVLRCAEWSKKEFLKELSRILGIAPLRGNFNANDLMREIVNFFKERINQKPLLIIDEADKLSPAALRNLIPLYNHLEGELGVVIVGTENLEKEMKQGVKFSKKGFDELDSRFGRNYIKLYGATKKEVLNICTANGIDSKEIASRIFMECKPLQKVVSGRTITVVEDLRRVKRVIQRELETAD